MAALVSVSVAFHAFIMVSHVFSGKIISGAPCSGLWSASSLLLHLAMATCLHPVATEQ